MTQTTLAVKKSYPIEWDKCGSSMRNVVDWEYIREQLVQKLAFAGVPREKWHPASVNLPMCNWRAVDPEELKACAMEDLQQYIAPLLSGPASGRLEKGDCNYAFLPMREYTYQSYEGRQEEYNEDLLGFDDVAIYNDIVCAIVYAFSVGVAVPHIHWTWVPCLSKYAMEKMCYVSKRDDKWDVLYKQTMYVKDAVLEILTKGQMPPLNMAKKCLGGSFLAGLPSNFPADCGDEVDEFNKQLEKYGIKTLAWFSKLLDLLANISYNQRNGATCEYYPDKDRDCLRAAVQMPGFIEWTTPYAKDCGWYHIRIALNVNMTFKAMDTLNAVFPVLVQEHVPKLEEFVVLKDDYTTGWKLQPQSLTRQQKRLLKWLFFNHWTRADKLTAVEILKAAYDVCLVRPTAKRRVHVLAEISKADFGTHAAPVARFLTRMGYRLGFPFPTRGKELWRRLGKYIFYVGVGRDFWDADLANYEPGVRGVCGKLKLAAAERACAPGGAQEVKARTDFEARAAKQPRLE